MIIGVRGADVVIVVVEDCIPVAGSFSMVGAWWCSPIEGPGIAELTRARWLRSSRLDPQSALQQAFHQNYAENCAQKEIMPRSPLHTSNNAITCTAAARVRLPL